VSVHLFVGARCQFIFSRNPVLVHLFVGARCRFIFSGKNDELTPDFCPSPDRQITGTLTFRPRMLASRYS
jgi:hypothetical protein